MSKLFWGFFFIFINFNLTFNEVYSLNVLPPFVGYLLLLAAIRELEGESSLFQGARPFAVGMAVYTALLWTGNLFGMGAGWIGGLLDLIATAAALYVEWVIIQGILDMETCRGAELNGKAMMTIWRRMLVVQIAAQLSGLLASVSTIGFLALVWMVLAVFAFVNVILFLMALWKGKKLYEDLEPQADGPETAE